LNLIQEKLIHVDNRVLQDLYDTFNSVSLVDQILKMTFPSQYNFKVETKADSIMLKSTQARPPQSDWKEVALRKSQKVFWTKELVQKYTWAFKSDVDMDPIFEQTSKQVKEIDN